MDVTAIIIVALHLSEWSVDSYDSIEEKKSKPLSFDLATFA
jgi:hypothetical protein